MAIVQIEKTSAEWEADSSVYAEDTILVEVCSTGYNRFKRADGTNSFRSLSYLDVIPPGSGGGGSVAWSDITGKPSDYPPSSHDHDGRYYTESEVDALLGGKSDTSHNHDGRYMTAHQKIPSNYFCYAYRSSEQSISASSLTLIGMDTEGYDPMNSFSLSSGSIVVPYAGHCEFSCNVQVKKNSSSYTAGSTAYIVFYTNSTNAEYIYRPLNNGSTATLSASIVRHVSANDKVSFRVYLPAASKSQGGWSANLMVKYLKFD